MVYFYQIEIPNEYLGRFGAMLWMFLKLIVHIPFLLKHRQMLIGNKAS
jgi:hypothetical protein